MIPGFEKLIEQRINDAKRKGAFENLPGSGKPLDLEEGNNIPEDLRLAFKILKNAGCVPPELEVRKDIKKTEELLENMKEAKDKYRSLKRLNFLIMKLNSMRKGSFEFDVPQRYMPGVVSALEKKKP
jgi:hypothetical protein